MAVAAASKAFLIVLQKPPKAYMGLSFYTSFPSDPKTIKQTCFLRYDTVDGEERLVVKERKDMTVREWLSLHIFRLFGYGCCSIKSRDLLKDPRQWKYLTLQGPNQAFEVANQSLRPSPKPRTSFQQMRFDILNSDNPLPETYRDLGNFEGPYENQRDQFERIREEISETKNQMEGIISHAAQKHLADEQGWNQLFKEAGLSALTAEAKKASLNRVIDEVVSELEVFLQKDPSCLPGLEKKVCLWAILHQQELEEPLRQLQQLQDDATKCMDAFVTQFVVR